MIELSKEELRQFARLEIDLKDLGSTNMTDRIVSNEFYQMTLQDLYDAMNNAIDRGMDSFDFKLSYFVPLTQILGKNLGLQDLYGSFPQGLLMYRLRSLNIEEDEMMVWVLKHLYLDFDDIDKLLNHFKKPLSTYEHFQELIEAIDCYYRNIGIETRFREYPDMIKRDFIMEWDNELLLSAAAPETRSLFSDFVMDLAEKDDPDAIRILGYASYGGNPVFENDMNLAAECMDRLWRFHGFGYAANTLAHMYYDGKLTGGQADLESAFKYFAIASFMGVTEATCSLCGMFIKGEYVGSNIELAGHTLDSLYVKALIRFENGERNTHLAEIAYHYSDVYRRLSNNPGDMSMIESYVILLKASYALKEEARAGGPPENSDLGVLISHRIKELQQDLFPPLKSSHKANNMQMLTNFIMYRGYCSYRAGFKRLKNNRVKVTVTRLKRGGEDLAEKTLLPYPEFGGCCLTDTLTFYAENVKEFAGFEMLPDEIIFDTVEDIINNASDRGSIMRFIRDGRTVFVLDPEYYTIKRPADIVM